MVQVQAELLYGQAPDRDARRNARQQLESVVLLEVLVTNADCFFDIADFRQGNGPNAQCAWCEKLISADGSVEIADPYFDPAKVKEFRVAFYLHFVDVAKPIRIGYGEGRIEELSPIPERLRTLIPYELLD